jgi:hypothetical protein
MKSGTSLPGLIDKTIQAIHNFCMCMAFFSAGSFVFRLHEFEAYFLLFELLFI